MKQTKMRLLILLLSSLTIILSLTLFSPVIAQNGDGDQAYYIVQEGDSLWGIGARFGVSVEVLQEANNISNPGQVIIGARLVIPGLKGVSGRVDTVTVAYGETLRSLSRRYNLSQATLVQLNRYVSPAELYAGATLIVPAREDQGPSTAGRGALKAGQSLLELAVVNGQNTWSLVLDNNLPGTWAGLPNDVIRVADSSSVETAAGFPESIIKVEVEPLQMVQGGTTVVKVYVPSGMELNGSLSSYDLNFFAQDDGYVALQGIHAMIPPGLYPLTLEAGLPGGERFAFSQNVIIRDANFPYDPSLQVDPVTLDPDVTKPEDDLWASLGAPVTLEKMWDGQFASPVPADFKDCWTSLFGNRRSYNGGSYDFFHSGLDFCGRVGTELYAVAPGKVVYVGMLTVRGGVVVIDHGWGVYTAYDHLSEFRAQPGDVVQPGQVIGFGGSTGRSTGPHLHWEVWVGGVQVNPVDWLNKTYP